MKNRHSAAELATVANRLRVRILEMACKAGGGHIGGSFSVIDILTGLYFRFLRHDSANPDWKERDRLVFSKGHSCLALYNVLAETGYFPVADLDRYCVNDGLFHGHPKRGLTPGVEATTGSLGHGLPISVGMALAAKLDGSQHRIVCILGDGECNEGSVWEAFMAGAQHKLSNLIAIIDFNKMESLDTVANILSIDPLAERLRNFGWSVREIDGNDMGQILEALDALPYEADKPSVIVGHTVKGKGVSFMEGISMWHYRGPTAEEAKNAFAELEATI